MFWALAELVREQVVPIQGPVRARPVAGTKGTCVLSD